LRNTKPKGTTLYRVRYRTPDHRSTQKRGFTTKRDAEMFAATVEVAKMRGEYVAPTVGKTTIGELGPAWLQRQRGHVKPSSLRAYESAWHVHIAPRWATRRIADIRRSDVAAWVANLSASRGPATVAMTYTVLKRILDDAVADRMLASKPGPRGEAAKTPPAAQRVSDRGSIATAGRRVRPLPVARAAARRWRIALG
jgi:hypothetical protein